MGFHVGEDLGDYKILAILGAGSMGRVFQVEHRLTRRKEALKVLSAELATETQIQRFEREIALQARLSHPNIATVHNAICWNGCLILVTEFLEGETLEKVLRRGKLPLETGINYIRQTLSALAYAHAESVIHRDVSPANLIITPSGTVKLTDFGLSKSFGDLQLTNHGDVVGNLDYMAPEQARGSAHTDARSDLYSAGAILYEVLTGRKPFGEGRKLAPLATHSENDPPRPTDLEASLQPEWNGVVAKALMRDPQQRYASASEFLQAIEQIAPTPAPNLPASRRRSSWITKASIAATAALLALLPAAATIPVRDVPPPAPIPFHIAPPQAEPISREIASLLAQTEKPKPPVRVHHLAPKAQQPAPEPGPQAPKKKGFWSKLNPFRRSHTP